MSYFFWGSLVLIVLTAVFYAVFFVLSNYWKEKTISVVVVPLLYTFEFFMTLFLIIAIITLLLQFTPAAIQLIGSSSM